MSRVRMPNAFAVRACPSSWSTMHPKSAETVATRRDVGCPQDWAITATQTRRGQNVTWSRSGMPATDATRRDQEGLCESFSSTRGVPRKRLHRRAYPMDALSARRVNMASSMSEKLESRAQTPEAALLQDRVDQLVRAHRVRGHMNARIDPLGIPRPGIPERDPAFFGLEDAHMDLPVSSGTMQWEGTPTLRRILERLRNTYCRYIGVQYMHIHDLEARRWLRDRMESTENRLALSREEQLRILTRLTDAAIFEEFLQKKYPGAKTFSLEGAESLIPLLDLAIERAAVQGIEEIVLAMAHRGRLNVLANILGKSPREIFREFE